MRRMGFWIVLPALLVLGGCAGTPRERVGTALGAAGGGLLGAQVGGGTGRTAAIIVGALIGSQVGKDIGRSIDTTDEAKAQAALERNRPATWVNPDTNAEITVNPNRTFEGEGSSYCREYTTEIVVAGRTERGHGTACRQPDGTWDMGSG